uniref:Uncharacterized protein n=1 Tax=Anguilla anguilla TaxID=7936 RepID=A0A0E9QLF1_ANGAN
MLLMKGKFTSITIIMSVVFSTRGCISIRQRFGAKAPFCNC